MHGETIKNPFSLFAIRPIKLLCVKWGIN